MTLRFDGRVAIVTGAGGGLGRAHALELARRGAKLVVNDLGADVDGAGGSSDAADAVVEEIRAMGGEAIANGASVCDRDGVAYLVEQTLDRFGRIDILVNNAGVLRDRSFHKMTLDDLDFVLDVHLRGAAYCSHAVWPVMRDQGYGRIVMTSSSTGLYGNFGQANYGAAKLGQVGLMNTLKLEGAKYDIRVNALVPIAATRMTEGLMPEQIYDLFQPDLVTPALVVLAHEDAPNGEIVSAGAGHFAKAHMVETPGVTLGAHASAEDVKAAWTELVSNQGQEPLEQGGKHTEKYATRAFAWMQQNAE
ncbi:3-oxoacyl-ACP reductase [Rhodothalassium salexigens]|uniref:SDR family oxidoreductase n=1 Tax=Rhodothalassium salexigens TaxID=1086 RepID=UPI001911F0AD|nr:SDR family oxidoreductase [Rhodothalassium salexigens]MBK5911682.1 3-oxoacyl-ACP reductase [Rhodothalassium salexigens]